MRAIVVDSHYKKLTVGCAGPHGCEEIDASVLPFGAIELKQAHKNGVGYFNAPRGHTAPDHEEQTMKLGDRWMGRWRRWQHRHWSLGVDDSGESVRWVCLHRQSGLPVSVVGAGQWTLGSEGLGMAQAGLESLPIALTTHAAVQRRQALPDGLAEEDVPAWVRARMAAVMHLSPADLAVDWGFESDGASPPQAWMAAVRASVVQQRVQWAQQRGAPLRILETPSSALARVLLLSAQEPVDPVWLWWAGRDEGQVCTGWRHLGQWHDRCDVTVHLEALGDMPGALVNLVKSAQTHKPTLLRKHWWWAGEPLAAWAAQWAADPPANCRDWRCEAAPIPWGRELESLTQASAHDWALAMGLALHPGWTE